MSGVQSVDRASRRPELIDGRVNWNGVFVRNPVVAWLAADGVGLPAVVGASCNRPFVAIDGYRAA